jgi:hypothetical protein
MGAWGHIGALQPAACSLQPAAWLLNFRGSFCFGWFYVFKPTGALQPAVVNSSGTATFEDVRRCRLAQGQARSPPPPPTPPPPPPKNDVSSPSLPLPPFLEDVRRRTGRLAQGEGQWGFWLFACRAQHSAWPCPMEDSCMRANGVPRAKWRHGAVSEPCSRPPESLGFEGFKGFRVAGFLNRLRSCSRPRPCQGWGGADAAPSTPTCAPSHSHHRRSRGVRRAQRHAP